MASIGSGFELTLLGKGGEDLAMIELRNFQTEYYPDSGTSVDAPKIGDALGQLVAEGLGAILRGQEFNPPSKPGMSGL